MDSLLRKLDLMFGLTGEVRENGDTACVIYRLPSGLEITHVHIAVTELGWQVIGVHHCPHLGEQLHQIMEAHRSALKEHPYREEATSEDDAKVVKPERQQRGVYPKRGRTESMEEWLQRTYVGRPDKDKPWKG